MNAFCLFIYLKKVFALVSTPSHVKSPLKRCRISKNSANKIICVIFEGHLFIFLIFVYF
ncbi:hypothetical protein D922_01013 [Enterococcus faecalis 06-MB-DW-09]|nr:hypothetical protein D931_00166 [Enterococcus faecium 13.SD.W.09]EPH95903.1 hypothetical protein D922_01013 [Enterococcus faecalis 06-MB-DW-09]